MNDHHLNHEHGNLDVPVPNFNLRRAALWSGEHLIHLLDDGHSQLQQFVDRVFTGTTSLVLTFLDSATLVMIDGMPTVCNIHAAVDVVESVPRCPDLITWASPGRIVAVRADEAHVVEGVVFTTVDREGHASHGALSPFDLTTYSWVDVSTEHPSRTKPEVSFLRAMMSTAFETYPPNKENPDV